MRVAVGGHFLVILGRIDVSGSIPCSCYDFLSSSLQMTPNVVDGTNKVELDKWAVKWPELDWINKSFRVPAFTGK